MKVLIADVESQIQDQMQVGLEAFEGVEVECAEGFRALELLRSSNYDCVFIGIAGSSDAGQGLFDRVSEEMQGTTVVVVAPAVVQAKLKEEKARGRILTFLGTPLQPVELYKTIHRIQSRLDAFSAH